MNVGFHSTRDDRVSVSPKEAILAGIAPDGGLFVSDSLGEKHLDLTRISAQDFHATAHDVLSALLGDYTSEELDDCIQGAYGTQWDTPAITPVTPLDNHWLLELFHGPTSAFKDVALQMLPRLMTKARTNSTHNILVVTATSGDTGKAALDGFKDVAGTGVVVFYPEGNVSDIQRLQMLTQEGSNVAVCAVRGTFDDAQTEVKRIFSDTALNKQLKDDKVALSSANSINIGRLAPQVTYYFDAYAQLVRRGALSLGERVSFCVPTGNFGDVLAGYFAKRMGLPVDRLIVASNSNNVLTDFIKTGTYDRRRPFKKTISPSMDILVSSNLERLLYYLSDGDVERIASFMRDLSEKGHYTVPSALLDRIQETFACGFATDDETRHTIQSTWRDAHVLIDPHTAVAESVLTRTSHEIHANSKACVCVSTASPFKFSSDVLSALGEKDFIHDSLSCMDTLAGLTDTVPPIPLSKLRDRAIIHSCVCDKDQMGHFVVSASQRIFR